MTAPMVKVESSNDHHQDPDDLALHSELPFNVISLCAGGRGLDRALELAFPAARTVLYVERESFAVAGLVAQIEAGLVAPAAVWSDVRTFNGRPWRGLVSCLAGGIPCQPHSLAGRRGGSTDERDLWSSARRIIAQMRPFLVLIENVGGFLSAGDDEVPGAERVRRDLQKLGYTVTGCIVRASDVRLPHERERVFVIGVADHACCGWGDPWLREQLQAVTEPDRGRSCLLADAASFGREGAGPTGPEACLRRRPSDPGDALDRRGPPAGVGRADACSPGLQRRGPAGGRAKGRTSAERDRGEVAYADGNRQHPAPGRGIHDPEHHPQPCGDAMVDPQGDGRREGRPEPELQRRRRAADGAGDELVNTIGGGHYGRPEGTLGRPVGRDAKQLAGADGGRPSLRPPGPGDAAAWRVIAGDRPDLLPALSGYDRFRIAMRDEGLAPAGARPSADLGSQEGQGRGVAGGSAHWVEAGTGRAVDPPVVQAAAQSALRRVADVMATRIDELRLLGNGVADAQGGLAIRIGLHDLAASGSAGAAVLVRLMEA